MKKTGILMAALCVALFNEYEVAAKVWLPQILSDHAVLQQNSDVTLWGKAAPKSEVTVRVSWSDDSWTTISDRDGNWKVYVRTPAGSYESHSITITDRDSSISVSDILSGEVWLCGGQSNMEMPLEGFSSCPVEGSAEIIATAGLWKNKIRDVKVPKTGAETVQDTVAGVWKLSTPDNARRFSAVGWFFAEMLNAVLDVPVGILECNWGGSAVESWLPHDIVYSYPENTIVDGKYSPGLLPQGWYYHTTPIVMYNAMLYPIRNYTIKGFLWYQGETNAGLYRYYAERLATMVSVWRDLWGEGDIPFYEVELAPWKYGGDGTTGARIREAQHDAVKLIPNSGIICTNDLVYPYEYDQIHPAQKRPVGFRLAYMALSRTYGIEGIICDSPEFKEMKINGGEVELSFHNDVMSFGPLHDMEGFEIAGEDRIFHPAEAHVDGKNVIVKSSEVPTPVAVRYCFRDFQLGNVTGRQGFPLVPFRTDDWE